MRPKSTGKDLPPHMLRRTKKLRSGKVWVSYYYNGRDANGRRAEIPLGGDLNEAKRRWADVDAGVNPHLFAGEVSNLPSDAGWHEGCADRRRSGPVLGP